MTLLALAVAGHCAAGQPATEQAKPAEPAKPAAKAPARDALNLLDQWLRAQQAFDRVPAISAGVVFGDELIWSQGYGRIDRQQRLPAGADTAYSICSISKLFTSVAVMQLWEQGRLSLDDDIGKLLPEFALQPGDPDSGPITVRSLLTHSSGMPREADASYWVLPALDFPDRATLYQGLRRQKAERRAGERFGYSNLGMSLLGDVVSAVAGMPYGDYVQSHLLAPLQMQSTGLGLGTGLPRERVATGFSAPSREGVRTPMPGFDTRALGAAAGYSSTVEDLARFARWQFRLLERGGQELLKVSTLREMHRVQWIDPDGKLTWGLGFAVTRDGADTVVSHDGLCPGYRSSLALVPRERLAVIALVNAFGHLGAGSDSVYSRGMRRLLQKGMKLEAAPQGGEHPVLSDYAGSYSMIGETLVQPWGKDLVLLSLPSTDPAAEMQVLKHIAGDRFRFVREDGEPGDELVFERNAAGRVSGFLVWSQRVPRLAS